MRTVPVFVKNGQCSLKIYALLDFYLHSSDIAGELGLQGEIGTMKVNLLNGQLRTFETMPVSFKLGSLNGKLHVLTTTHIRLMACLS